MAKEFDKITMIQSSKTVNYTTGEVTETQDVTNIRKSTEPDFIKLYLNTLLTFKDLSTACSPLLLSLLGRMSYSDMTKKDGGQVIYLNSVMKKEISVMLKMKMNTLDKKLGDFVKAGIFKRLGTGTYQVNPYLFGKGVWKDISAIRATLDFNLGTMEAIITQVQELNEILTEERNTPPQEEQEAIPKGEYQLPFELPKNKEDCRTHEECIAYVKFVLKYDKPSSAYYIAQELGLPTLSREEAEAEWERLGESA